MKTKIAIAHFGSAKKLAESVGISKGAVSQWGDIVPIGTAIVLEKITNGILNLEFSDYPKRKFPHVSPLSKNRRSTDLPQPTDERAA